MKLRLKFTACLLVVACLTAATQAQPLVISVNFEGGVVAGAPTSLAPADTAGVWPQQNWNNAPSNAGTLPNLVDNLGNPSAASITYNATATYGSGTGTDTDDAKMLNGYLDTFDNLTSKITFNGLAPNSLVSVIGYHLPDNLDGRSNQYSVTSDPSQPTYYLTSTGDASFQKHGYVQATSTTPGTYSAGNYTEWDNVKVNAVGQVVLQGNGSFRNYWNGVQLQLPAATRLVWNGGGGTSAPADAGGTWDTGTNWWNGAAGASWSEGSAAVFGAATGSAGTVTISGAVKPASLTFQPTIDSSTYTISSGSIDLNGASCTINTIVNATIDSTLIDPQTNGEVFKVGAGRLTLSNANSFTGPVVFAGGTVAVPSVANGGTNSPLGAGTSLLFNGGTLEHTGADSATDRSVALYSAGGAFQVDNPSTTLTLSGVISGEGGLTATGPGTLTLLNTNTYTGSTTINGGTLQLNSFNGSQGQLAGTPLITVNQGGTLALNAGDVLGYTNGAEALTINSGGVVTNITSGSRVTIQNLLTITGGALTGTGTGDAFGAYSFNNGAVGILATSDPNGNPAVISATISPQNTNLLFTVNRGSAAPPSDLNVTSAIVPWGGNGIVKDGGGVMTLTANNTYTGATTVSNGTLQLGDGTPGHDGSLATSGVTNNAALVYNLNGTQTPGYIISGSGSLTKAGSGTLALVNANTYTGNTKISGGTLQLGDGTPGHDGSLTTSGVTNNAALVYNLNGTQTIVYSISGAGSLTKTGTGTLVLGTQQNSYSGPTVVSAGTLKIAAIATGAEFHLDASAASTFSLSGSQVSQWNDVSDNGNHAYAINNGAMPTLVGGALHGLPVVDFGTWGSGQWLKWAGPSLPTGDMTDIRTVFLVLGSQNGGGFLLGDDGTNGNIANFHRGPGPDPNNPFDPGNYRSKIWGWDAAGGPVNPANGGRTYLNGANVDGFNTNLDGGYQLVDVTTTLNATANDLASDRYYDVNNPGSGNIGFGNGRTGGQQIAEVIIYNTPLTDAQRISTEEYLMNKWELGGGAGGLSAASALQVAAGATVDLNGTNQSVASLADSGGSGGLVTNGSVTTSTLTVSSTDSSTSTTFSGTIQDGVGRISLLLSGSGTLVLAGNNTYTGGTVVQGGTLILASPGAIQDGTSLTVGADASTIFGSSVADGQASAAVVSPVPEPSTLLLLFAGLVGFCVWRKTKGTRG